MNGRISRKDTPEELFEIPLLPGGRLLRFTLLSNWGDLSYIGLKAIEVFTHTGKRAEVHKISTNATQSVGLLDSIFIESFTYTECEHMWKTEMGDQAITIDIEFSQTIKIAMIRIWNYNESRVHAQIGVRDLRIHLDDVIIFRGEINCAYSATEDFESMGDTVLFTIEDSILEAIAENDVCLLTNMVRDTSTLDISIPEYALEITPERPLTSQESSLSKVSNEILPSSIVNEDLTDEVLGMVKVFHMELSSNWGSPDCIGLTGLEFMGARGEVIDTEAVSISVSNAQSGVEKILNGKNLTRSNDDMWMTTFDAKTPPIIMVQFPKPVAMTGVRVAQLFVNGRLAVGNLLLRKAPGYVFFDFVQDTSLYCPFVRPAPSRPLTHSIGGFIFQLRLLSSWGDEFYIGLNGIELYNRKDEKMMLKTHNLAAFPESINILPAVDGDPRTSENLIDNCNDMDRPEHMWLTPLFPNRCARVFFIFDVPTFISRMIVYNYRKTPTRGVRHISLSVDDLIIFSGEVPISSDKTTGIVEINMRET